MMKRFLSGILFTGLMAVSIPAFAACPCKMVAEPCCPQPACPCPVDPCCDPCLGLSTFTPGENLRVAKTEMIQDPCGCGCKKVIKVFKVKPVCPCPCDPCA